MPIQVKPAGPIPAQIMIVGEAPGVEEERLGEPFVGASGNELNRMLHEAGISRSECFITNVCRERPPGNDISLFFAETKKERTDAHILLRDKYVLPPIYNGYNLLLKEIEIVQPSIIITLGNTSLWALTGKWGITKWRGSMLHSDHCHARLLPTYHPAAILRQWDWRATAVHDLRRAAEYRSRDYPSPGWRFRIRPSLDDVQRTLGELIQRATANPLVISFDLETRHGHIACAGISWSLTEALCIPFMCVEDKDGYWSLDEETAIVRLLHQLLTHPNVAVIGQNLLFDSQYTYRHWFFVPRVVQDSMISHHTAFAGLPKRLDFQASLYCNQYIYWKDDGKTWNKNVGEDQLWAYNCEDCVRTMECADTLDSTIRRLNLVEVDRFQQSMFWPVLAAMQRGVRIDQDARAKLAGELLEALSAREAFIQDILGHPLNPRSPKQMQALFYEDLGLPKVISRKTGKPTLDEDALQRLTTREPLIRPLVKAISEYRSLGVFLSTFVKAPLDSDGRMRCSYNICGTETYRLSSSENAFGSGTNLQNIPAGTKAKEPDDLALPNIRKIFIPDPGYVFFDMDLDRADLQVVVWEANDAELKRYLQLGVDIHLANAYALFDKVPDVSLLIERHSIEDPCTCPGQCYWEFRTRRETERRLMKSWVHGTNYGGSPRTMAINCGITIKEAEKMQRLWFGAHPGIQAWHIRTEKKLQASHQVENAYGYRRFYFERIDGLLPEALAWIPQSTVAITINKIWKNIYDNLPEVQVLLQVHDSLAGQFPVGFSPSRLLEQTKIVIPYPDPLIIPAGLKLSKRSWGDCK